MSTHPNVLLIAVLTPDGLARQTMRAIREETGVADDDDRIAIGAYKYHSRVFENDYDEDRQIQAAEGDLVFFDHVTYGYGETIAWPDLVKQVAELEEWAACACTQHHCTFKIKVGANYW